MNEQSNEAKRRLEARQQFTQSITEQRERKRQVKVDNEPIREKRAWRDLRNDDLDRDKFDRMAGNRWLKRGGLDLDQANLTTTGVIVPRSKHTLPGDWTERSSKPSSDHSTYKNYPVNGKTIAQALLDSPTSHAWAEIIEGETADSLFEEVDLWLSNDICRALDHPDRPPSDLELDDLPWDPNHPGDYLILLRDESSGEIACQTGCAVDQSVGQRYAHHVGMVDSIIKDQETDCACNLSLTYAFWTSPNVKAKFATVASVPFQMTQAADTSRKSRVTIRLIETFISMWLKTWNGSHSDIPRLQELSRSAWRIMYPDFNPQHHNITGLTSHTPLKETTAELVGFSLKANLAKISAEIALHASARIKSSDKNTEELAQRIYAQIKRLARREPRNHAYHHMNSTTKTRLLEGRRVDWNARSEIIKADRNARYAEEKDFKNANRRAKAAQRTQGEIAKDNAALKARRKGQAVPKNAERSTEQLEADKLRSLLTKGKPQGSQKFRKGTGRPPRPNEIRKRADAAAEREVRLRDAGYEEVDGELRKIDLSGTQSDPSQSLPPSTFTSNIPNNTPKRRRMLPPSGPPDPGVDANAIGSILSTHENVLPRSLLNTVDNFFAGGDIDDVVSGLPPLIRPPSSREITASERKKDRVRTKGKIVKSSLEATKDSVFGKWAERHQDPQRERGTEEDKHLQEDGEI